MRVSALIVVRNGAAYIAEALASIQAQTRAVDEILVLDGGSDDETRAIAAGIAGVRVIAQKGHGLAAARNQAVAAATGDAIAFLSHDDRWTPDKTKLQLGQLAAGARPGLALGALVEFGAAAAHEAPRLARTPDALLADRAAFERVGPFDPAFGAGCDMEWFARAGLRGVPLATSDQVVLEKRRHGRNLSADAARNRDDAFAVLARIQALRRRGG
ncbi:MAG: glycosyltransferase family 2 protein [Rhodospirillaceae bacterium]|nr:glycosyltransferase family 2 protein [Rhodospirillaceae bacterium]